MGVLRVAQERDDNSGDTSVDTSVESPDGSPDEVTID
jgi:hypothetical protein